MKKLVTFIIATLMLQSIFAGQMKSFEIREKVVGTLANQEHIRVEIDGKSTMFLSCNDAKNTCNEISTIKTEAIREYFNTMRNADRLESTTRKAVFTGAGIATAGLVLVLVEHFTGASSQIGETIVSFGLGVELCAVGFTISTEEKGDKRRLANLLENNMDRCENKEVDSLSTIKYGIASLTEKLL